LEQNTEFERATFALASRHSNPITANNTRYTPLTETLRWLREHSPRSPKARRAPSQGSALGAASIGASCGKELVKIPTDPNQDKPPTITIVNTVLEPSPPGGVDADKSTTTSTVHVVKRRSHP
jgi:hypothetical protein